MPQRPELICFHDSVEVRCAHVSEVNHFPRHIEIGRIITVRRHHGVQLSVARVPSDSPVRNCSFSISPDTGYMTVGLKRGPDILPSHNFIVAPCIHIVSAEIFIIR